VPQLGGPEIVINGGTIIGTGLGTVTALIGHGVRLKLGGTVTNLVFAFLGSGYFGIEIDGNPGTVINSGTVEETGRASP
jgi:hypothetical protein